MFGHAVIGAGAMGANHARVTGNIRDVDITLVVDADAARARALAEATGARWATSLPETLDCVDTAVVAVPTEWHRDYAVCLMDRGVHVLVEKPLAETLADAQALVDAAEANGVVLMVGHVEQFNPAILELSRWIDDVVHVDSTRVGPYSTRVREGVVFDLMIHDLDIIRRIVQSPLVEVHAVARRTRSATEDLACALLRFANGVTASMTASRISQNKVRQLEITQQNSTVSVDLLQQSLMIRRMSQSEFVPAPGGLYRQSGVVEIPFLDHWGEPLQHEVRHFFDCVKAAERPRVSGQDGLESLRWALRVARAAQPAA
jgi:UDP-N-acetylglucosamine 3-dehydrogenase